MLYEVTQRCFGVTDCSLPESRTREEEVVEEKNEEESGKLQRAVMLYEMVF